jgi:hypothetical protein
MTTRSPGAKPGASLASTAPTSSCQTITGGTTPLTSPAQW